MWTKSDKTGSPKVSFQFRDILRTARRTKTRLMYGDLQMCIYGAILKDFDMNEFKKSSIASRDIFENKLSSDDKAKLRLIENGFEYGTTQLKAGDFDRSVWDGKRIESSMSEEQRLRYFRIGQRLHEYVGE